MTASISYLPQDRFLINAFRDSPAAALPAAAPAKRPRSRLAPSRAPRSSRSPRSLNQQHSNTILNMAPILSDFFTASEIIASKGALDRPISGIVMDSRRVVPGNLFFALPGLRTDGSAFIDEAINRGAVAIVTGKLPLHAPGKATFIQVADPRAQLARVARRYYRFPDRDLSVIGVTGTNGKTTVTHLLGHLLNDGRRVGLLGTINYDIGARTVPSFKTTPESIDIHGMLAQMRDAGCRHAVMEVSSHGIDQQRVLGMDFSAAIFTNLTRDHLDYHKNLDSYFDVKARLFTGLAGAQPKLAIINLDDPRGPELVARIRATDPAGAVKILTYGESPQATIRAENISLNYKNTTFRLTWPSPTGWPSATGCQPVELKRSSGTGDPPVFPKSGTGDSPVFPKSDTGDSPVCSESGTGCQPVGLKSATGDPPVFPKSGTGCQPVELKRSSGTGDSPVFPKSGTGDPPVFPKSATGCQPVLPKSATGDSPVCSESGTGCQPVGLKSDTGDPPVLPKSDTGCQPVYPKSATGDSPVLPRATGDSPVPSAPPPPLHPPPPNPNTQNIHSPLIGRYNVSNLLAAIATAIGLGRDPLVFLPRLKSFTGVPGRMERIEAGQPYNALVDYAHTDDALRNALGMLRSITPGRLLVVFGCGGNRDRAKRPLMMRAVQDHADHAFATADNPRSEPLQQIFADMRAGVIAPEKLTWIEDRRRAISLALDMAKPGDCLLVAGKGHETYQEFADTVIPFDDRQTLRELIALKTLKT